MAARIDSSKPAPIILISFVLFFIAWHYRLGIRPFHASIDNSTTISYALNMLLSGLIPAVALCLLYGMRGIVPALGLQRTGVRKGLIFAGLATLPMLAGYALFGDWNRQITLPGIAAYAFVVPFIEETVYRGFVFGRLFRASGWGFLPAASVAAVPLALVYLFQGQCIISVLGLFFSTAIGSMVLCWIYAEWNFNLWCVVWLHVLMALTRMLFVIDSAHIGSVTVILHYAAILSAIGLTIFYKKRRGLPCRITPKKLICNETYD